MQSAKTIQYKDLVRFVEARLQYMRKHYPGLKLCGKISAQYADREIACAESLLRLLRKHQRNRQLNLNDLFIQQLNPKK